MIEQLKTVYEALVSCVEEQNVKRQHALAGYTSMRVGGPAALYVRPQSLSELFDVLALAESNGILHMVMGNGSNLIFDDEGYDGLIIHIAEGIDRMLIEEGTVFAEAGALVSSVARAASDAGLTGMEFACGIPGSVGGAVYMNGGAYGRDMSDIVHTVSSLAPNGIVRDRRGADAEFGYRTSVFQKNGEIIFGVKLQLEPGDPACIRDTIADFTKRRTTKQPLSQSSAGSFFKRPPGHYAGKLIEDAGLKGLSCGGARVSDVHAGFIVNDGEATARDLLDLMRVVQETVLAATGILLEPEVRLLRRDGSQAQY